MKMKFDIGIGDKSVKAKVSRAMRTKFYFGRNVENHCVYQLTLKGDDGITYEVNVPIMLQDGEAWEFGRDESRAVTEDDQTTNWNDVMNKFPSYGGDKTLGQEQFAAFVEWLASGNATCVILPRGVNTDRNGVEHHNAAIVRPLAVEANNDAPVAPAPKATKVPPKPKAKPIANATRDDAWTAYASGKCIVSDPQGEKFNEMCDLIIGRDSAYATAEDWARCVEAFSK